MDQGGTCATHSQTELTGSNITDLQRDNRARVLESASVTTCSLYDRETYVGAAEKACFYTGLPSVEVLDAVFRLVEQHLPSLQKWVNVQRCFHATLDVLYVKLAFLIKWPEREQLRKTMSMCFIPEQGGRHN